ncbi:hypothetical protein pb186bvf_016193 [Paramecium bursaria]
MQSDHYQVIKIIALVQILFQQYLIHISICCLVNDFKSLLYNGIGVTIFGCLIHCFPFEMYKLRYLFEYVLLLVIHLALLLNLQSMYLSGSLLGMEIVILLVKLCRVHIQQNDKQLSLLKLCVGLLKCFLGLQVFFIALKFQNIIAWAWAQVFIILWFMLTSSIIIYICMLLNQMLVLWKRFNQTPEQRLTSKFRFYGGIWYTLQSTNFVVNPFLTLINVSQTLSGESFWFFLPILLTINFTVLIISYAIRDEVKQYYQQCTSYSLTNADVESENIPRQLIRISSTYFKTADKKFEELPTSPRRPDDEQKCAICFDREADYVLMNCGHGGLCLKCSSEIFKKQLGCYLCRQPIQKIFQVSKADLNFVDVVGVVQE